MAANLPYGMQRRLEVARALAARPQLLLLDEPTAGMNPQETAGMIALIRRLRDELGLAVLLIEHDMRLVMGVSERVTVLNHGAEDRRRVRPRTCSGTSGWWRPTSGGATRPPPPGDAPPRPPPRAAQRYRPVPAGKAVAGGA